LLPWLFKLIQLVKLTKTTIKINFKGEKLKILVFFILFINLFSQDILNKDYSEKFKLSKQKIIKESKKLKIDWINPITYTYSYSDDKKLRATKTSIISINQPIFRSGGIYNAIKYASNLKNLNETNLALQKKELIKQAIKLTYQIKEINLKIKKQKNLIKNAQIDLKLKKEAVFNGLLDISFLNNAIINKNKLKLGLIDLESNKAELVNNLANISKLKYDEINLPKFKFISLNDFTQKNIYIKKETQNYKVKHNFKYMTYAKYLPSINLNYQKSWNHTKNSKNEVYGFNVVIPLDFKAFYEPKSVKLDEMIAKKEIEIKKEQEINFFKTTEFKIKQLENKIKLTKENILAYKNLFEQMQELVKAGLKTNDDLEVLKNSLKNEKIDLQIHEIEQQLNLLDIYSRISN